LKLRKYSVGLLIVFIIIVISSALAFAADQTALERILNRGKIIVATDASIKPLSFISSKTDKIEGFEPDLAKLYAEKLGVEIELMDYSWAGLFPALQSGKVDLVAANITMTIPRTAKLGFVEPWLITGGSVMVRKDAVYKSLEDLNSEDVTIGATKGSVYADSLKKRHYLFYQKE